MRVILFNLAPYREKRDHAQRQMFMVQALAVLVVSVLVGGWITSSFSGRVKAKEEYLSKIQGLQVTVQDRAQAVARLKEEVTALQKQVNVLKSVEADSYLSSQLLSVIDRSVPEGVFLQRIQLNRHNVVLFGRTNNVKTLAQWTQYLKGFPDIYREASVVRVMLIPAANQSNSKASSMETGVSAAEAVHEFELKLDVAIPAFQLTNGANRGGQNG